MLFSIWKIWFLFQTLKLQGKEGLLKTFFENPNLSIHFLENYNVIYYNLTVAGPEKLKKSRPKKLVKSNKSISRIYFFGQIPFFAISKLAKNQFLNWEKV